MQKGKFISLEGGEGSGKSSAIACIEDWLQSQGIHYVMTREPGGTPLAEEIRALVLKPRNETVDDMAELLMMYAARAQHLAQKIIPALNAGSWVISDRFVDSSYVYQGIARGGKLEQLEQLTKWVVAEHLPDATLLLDVSVETGLQRVGLRQDADRLDQESVGFHQKVRQGFLACAKAEPERVQVINAELPIKEVHQQIVKQLERLNSAWLTGA